MAMHSWSLQTAIYGVLTADGALLGLDGATAISVYDDVPKDTAYPYVVIGEESTINNGSKTLDGIEHTITIHVWSQYRGRYEIKHIMQSIYENLHNADITVTDASLVNIRQEFSTTLQEADGITRHGVMRFRVAMFDS